MEDGCRVSGFRVSLWGIIGNYHKTESESAKKRFWASASVERRARSPEVEELAASIISRCSILV